MTVGNGVLTALFVALLVLPLTTVVGTMVNPSAQPISLIDVIARFSPSYGLFFVVFYGAAIVFSVFARAKPWKAGSQRGRTLLKAILPNRRFNTDSHKRRFAPLVLAG